MSRYRNVSRKNTRKKSRQLKKANPKFIHFLSLVFVISGIGLLLFPSVFRNFTETKTKQSSPKTTQLIKAATLSQDEPIKIDGSLVRNIVYKEPPLRIVIPDLAIDLPIVMAKIINGYWELSETTASHGMGSANPGEIGNTVIFAHAREGLFLPLRNIKKDQSIYVLTPNNWLRYKVEEIKEVTSDKIEVIAPSQDERLTLFTCSGFLDSKRLIVVARPNRP
ncbi:sortase [Candidatus Gottesmanbacteria bacterium]|nr:sortase [Candidatus Gottesmanbacteria bacterium]